MERASVYVYMYVDSSEVLGNISISASHSIYNSVLVCKMKTLDETTLVRHYYVKSW